MLFNRCQHRKFYHIFVKLIHFQSIASTKFLMSYLWLIYQIFKNVSWIVRMFNYQKHGVWNSWLKCEYAAISADLLSSCNGHPTILICIQSPNCSFNCVDLITLVNDLLFLLKKSCNLNSLSNERNKFCANSCEKLNEVAGRVEWPQDPHYLLEWKNQAFQG